MSDTWFKARNKWGKSIGKLSDAEAGRFAKALWHYVATGEEDSLQGREGILLDIAIEDLHGDQEERARISAARSEAGKKGGRPKAETTSAESKKSNCFSEKAKESSEKQLPQIRNKKKESSSVGFFDDDDDEPMRIALEHSEVLDAAQRAGMGTTDGEREKLIDLYAQHGKEAMLTAFDACIEHGAKSLAYLRKVLEGGARSIPPKTGSFAADGWL